MLIKRILLAYTLFLLIILSGGIRWPLYGIILLRVEDILINSGRLKETSGALVLVYCIRAKSFWLSRIFESLITSVLIKRGVVERL
jgi:hypothetical protein